MDDLNIIDTIMASTIEAGDQILIGTDPVEVRGVLDQGETIYIRGYSHDTGGMEEYSLPADSYYDLWAV